MSTRHEQASSNFELRRWIHSTWLALGLAAGCSGVECPQGAVKIGGQCVTQSDHATETAITPGTQDAAALGSKAPGSGSLGTMANAAAPAPAPPVSGSNAPAANAGSQVGGTAAANAGSPAGRIAAKVCGNGQIESGETCDGNCPTSASCTSPDPCLAPRLLGSAQTCDAECTTAPITACASGDRCCPANCTSVTDSDCSANCGNGTVEDGEICDPSSSCPTSCDDGDPCTTDVQTGSIAQCNVKCTSMPVVAAKNGDGCCPANASANNDSDCSPSCGNNVVEGGETCDPSTSCRISCDDGDPCTLDRPIGSADRCTADCAPPSKIAADRSTSDRCCPDGATLRDDPDCPAPTGWSVVNPGSCSGAGALQLHASQTVSCGALLCQCSRPSAGNCSGSLTLQYVTPNTLVVDSPVTITGCGGGVGNSGSAFLKVHPVNATPTTTGCVLSGTSSPTVTLNGQETYCPANPVRSSSCLTMPGETSCPTGYARKLLYTGSTGAACECTGCGFATRRVCDGYFYAAGQPICSAGHNELGPEGATLGEIDPLNYGVWIRQTNPTCAEIGAKVVGNMQPTGETTVCCPQ